MNPRVSVCLATYNGVRHVEEQLQSILADLEPTDELIIVDDFSTDKTVEIIQRQRDPRLRLYRLDANVGHVRAFEQAIRHARGDYISLSDQDDIWPLGRTSELLATIDSAQLSAGNYSSFGATEGVGPRHPFAPRSAAFSRTNNVARMILGRIPYMGSTMMFRSELVSTILPFPTYVEAHDHWIALVANVQGRVQHTDSVVTLRRIHESNLTPTNRRSMAPVLKTRVVQGRMILEAMRRRWSR